MIVLEQMYKEALAETKGPISGRLKRRHAFDVLRKLARWIRQTVEVMQKVEDPCVSAE